MYISLDINQVATTNSNGRSLWCDGDHLYGFICQSTNATTHLCQKEIGSPGEYGSPTNPGLVSDTLTAPCMHKHLRMYLLYYARGTSG